MGNLYEIVFVVKPDAVEETLKGIVQKVKDTIEGGVEGLKGEAVKIDEWGKRRLAYLIQNYQEGYYFLVNFSGAPQISKEIERALRLNENILRFQTIRVKKKKTPIAKETKEGAEVKNV